MPMSMGTALRGGPDHNWRMPDIRRKSRLDSQIRMIWEHSSPERRGRLIVVLWCNAVTVVLTEVGLVVCMTRSIRGTWRLRERGLTRAAIDGSAWSGTALLAVASGCRRLILRRLITRMASRIEEAAPDS